MFTGRRRIFVLWADDRPTPCMTRKEATGELRALLRSLAGPPRSYFILGYFRLSDPLKADHETLYVVWKKRASLGSTDWDLSGHTRRHDAFLEVQEAKDQGDEVFLVPYRRGRLQKADRKAVQDART